MLERLHASLFFYLLTSSDFSLKIGMFLPSVICVSVAMMFHGLGIWTSAGWTQIATAATELEKPRVAAARRTRPVLPVLAIIAMTHTVGVVLFYLVNSAAVATSSVRRSLLLSNCTLTLAIVPTSSHRASDCGTSHDIEPTPTSNFCQYHNAG